MPLRAVTFDFHDTLARCDEWFQIEVRELVPRVMDWHSIESGTVVDSELRRRATQGYRALRAEIIHHGEEQDAVTCAVRVLTEMNWAIDRDRVATGIETIMRSSLAGSVPVEGAVEAVRELASRGVALGVVSSAVYHPFLEWSLEKFGVLDCFDVIVTSASAGFYKSRAEIYHHALRHLGAAPEESVHVGDSYQFDVQGARRAGMRTVWLDSSGNGLDKTDADVTVANLRGLAPLLLRKFGGEARTLSC